MRIRARQTAPDAEGDLTPMIDMTFQLIAFFMVLINFSDAEQDQRITLPNSDLAKPPEAAYENKLTVQLTKDDMIVFAGEETSSLTDLTRTLSREKQILELDGKTKAVDVTIIIRADKAAPSGRVQEIMQTCQDVGFLKFVLRGKQVLTAGT